MSAIDDQIRALEEKAAKIKAAAGQRPTVASGADLDARIKALEDRKQQLAPMGYAEDTARSMGAGTKSGAEGLVGGAEDLSRTSGGLMQRLASYLGMDETHSKAFGGAVENVATSAMNPVGGAAKMLRRTGVLDPLVGKENADAAMSVLSPSTEQVKTAVETAAPITKRADYEPKYLPGKLAKTGTEFAVGASVGGPRKILQRAAEGFLSGVASEGAGQATEGLGYLEPAARILGGVAGGTALSSELLRKGGNTTRGALAQIRKGVPITAGQAIDSKGLQRVEHLLNRGKVEDIYNKQRDSFTAQAMADMGAPAGQLMTPENMQASLDRIRGTLNKVESGVGDVNVPQASQQKLLDAVKVYKGVAGDKPNRIVQDIVDDVRAGFMANKATPVLNGTQLSEIRGRINDAIEGGADGATLSALKKMQETLDDSVESHLGLVNPELQGQWKEGRTQYRKWMGLAEGGAQTPLDAKVKGQTTPQAVYGGGAANEGVVRSATGKAAGNDLGLEGAQAFPRVDDTNAGKLATEALQSSLSGMAVAGIGKLGLGQALMSKPVQNFIKSQGNNARAGLIALMAAYKAQESEKEKARAKGQK